MRAEVINFQKWVYPVPLPLFCPRCLVAHAGMATSLTQLGSRGIEADIPEPPKYQAHNPRRGIGCLGNEQLCLLISFIFELDVHLFTIPTAMLLITIAHTCHESTPPHTCSLTLTMLCHGVKSKGRWLCAKSSSSIDHRSIYTPLDSVLFNIFVT